MIEVKLEVVGGAKQTEVPLKKLPTIIGRGREVGLTLPHALVSRQHCELHEIDGHLYVKDLESLNGTYVNNQRISGQQILLPNQLLTLGNVTFRARYEIPQECQHLTSDLQRQAIAAGNATGAKRPATKDSTDTQPMNDSPDQVIRTPAADKETVYEDKKKQTVYEKNPASKVTPVEAVAASDTGKSLDEEETSDSGTFGSELFIEDEDLVSTQEQSVSLSSLDELPTAQASASFAGGVQVSDEHDTASDPIGGVQIDLGEDQPDPPAADNSSLDSFIRRLPK